MDHRTSTLSQNTKKLLLALQTYLQRNQDLDANNLLILGGYETQLTDLLLRLQPHRIGIIGAVSVGKSRLLNTLLETTFQNTSGLLQTGIGSTTAVPFEIRRSTDERYHAEIQFINPQDLKDLLRELARLYSENEPDARIVAAIRSRLRGVFTNQSIPKKNNNIELAFAETPIQAHFNCVAGAQPPHKYIGKQPEHFTTETAQQLFELLQPFTVIPKDNVPFLAAVVSRIILTIPSTRLPPGITLVDTPGLGDANAMNPRRTEALYHSLNEYWYLTRHSEILATERDHKAVQQLFCLGKKLNVVATQCGVENPREIAPIRSELMKIYVGKNPLDFTEEELDQFNENQTDTEQRINEINIAFTEVSLNFQDGIDDLSAWLDEIHNNRLANLAQGEILFANILSSIENTGIIRCNLDLNAIDHWRADFQNELLRISQLHFNIPQCYNAVIRRGDWNGNQNSLKAALRRYGGPHYAANGKVWDLNLDLSMEWTFRTTGTNAQLRDIVARRINQIREILGQELETNQILNAGLMNIQQAINILNDCFGGAGVINTCRTISTQLQVYPYGIRRQIPNKIVSYHTEQVFQTIFNQLTQNFQIRIQEAGRVIQDLVGASARLVEGIPAFQGAPELLQLLQVVNIPDDFDLTCPITHELFVEPCQTLPCRHLFNLGAIETWRIQSNNCPVCRGEINSVMRRYDLEAMAILNQPPRGQEENWIVGLWAQIVQQVEQELAHLIP